MGILGWIILLIILVNFGPVLLPLLFIGWFVIAMFGSNGCRCGRCHKCGGKWPH